MTSEQRALEELARRRVRAVGRCPECGERVEHDDDWVRIEAHAYHTVCADAEETTPPEPVRYLTG